jgi:hypothetical protein
VIDKADISFNQPEVVSEESVSMLSPPSNRTYKHKKFATITKVASDNNTNSYLENLQATLVIQQSIDIPHSHRNSGVTNRVNFGSHLPNPSS